jgi:hypothetical protein
LAYLAEEVGYRAVKLYNFSGREVLPVNATIVLPVPGHLIPEERGYISLDLGTRASGRIYQWLHESMENIE